MCGKKHIQAMQRAGAAMSDSRDFNWGDIDADIVAPEQPAIVCYTNPNGAVVLRQAGQYGLEDDHWVYFYPDHAHAIAAAIMKVAGVGTGETASKDQTAAERQRRYRERKKRDRNGSNRDALRDGDVTEVGCCG